jgi:hypothetical protein
VYGW